MAHEERLSGKDLAAGDVVVMVVTVDYIAHRLIREVLDLPVQPGRRFRADGIGDDNSLWRDDKDRLMRLMPEQIHFLGQLGDFIGRTRLLGGGGKREEQQAK